MASARPKNCSSGANVLTGFELHEEVGVARGRIEVSAACGRAEYFEPTDIIALAERYQGVALIGNFGVNDGLRSGSIRGSLSSPSPRSCGERVGVRGCVHSYRTRGTPPHPPSLRSVDLSPRAGRGEDRASFAPPSHIQHPPIRIQHGFLHHLRQRRMREHGVHQLFFGGLQIHRHHVALDQLGDFGADHVGAQQLAGSLVEDHFDQPLVLTERNGLAVADERKAADANVEFFFPWRRLP